jgi:hypothetical protein
MYDFEIRVNLIFCDIRIDPSLYHLLGAWERKQSFRAMSCPHRIYLWFDVVVELVWPYDPYSFAGGNTAAGRISHGGRDDTD